MSHTYTKIYLHIVFAVKDRESLIFPVIAQRLYPYMSATLRNFHQNTIAIGGIENHVHLLIDYHPSISVPDLIREIKTSATKFINNNHFFKCRFAWQRGYSCFSHSASQIETVKQYIENQYIHHKNRTFVEELVNFYDRYGIVYDPQYLPQE